MLITRMTLQETKRRALSTIKGNMMWKNVNKLATNLLNAPQSHS